MTGLTTDESAHHLLQKEVESHLQFFKRRQEIEARYVQDLKDLALRENPSDDKDRLAQLLPEAWRTAAHLLRENTLVEAQTHAASAEGLSKMVKNLNDFRDNKERMRRRIRDELKDNAHADYKAVVARLRKSYERKVEELQAHELEERERERHEQHGSSSSLSATLDSNGFPPEHWNSSSENSIHVPPSQPFASSGVAGTRERTGSSASSRGGDNNVDSPPQHPVGSPPTSSSISSPPVFVSGAGSGHSSSAYREPPTSSSKGGNVFEQIAKRDWSGEKHRINSIARVVGNLAKGSDGGSVASGLNSKSGSVKGQKARQLSTKMKREAEQADRDYRDGIFRLETLRLHRMRLQLSAQQFLKEYAIEYSVTLKDICSSVPAIARVLRTNQDPEAPPGGLLIEPVADGEKFASMLRSPVPEPPVYYVNYFVGECRSLLFGVSLSDYHSTNPDRLVPLIVQKCIDAVDLSGLQVEGIYRISGKLATVQTVIHEIERDEESFSFRSNDDPAMIAGVLKLYLRQLPFPLFPVSGPDRSNYSADFLKDPDTCITTLSRRIRRLGLPNQATLKVLCEHLSRVVAFEHVNKMNASNLGTIFAPVVFGEDEALTLEMARRNDHMMDVLILNHTRIFEGLPAESGKPRSRGTSVSSGSMPPPPPSLHQLGESLSATSISRRPDERHLEQQSTQAIPPASQAMDLSSSRDTVFQLYQETTHSLLPHEQGRPSVHSSPLAQHHFEAESSPSSPPPLPSAPVRHSSAPMTDLSPPSMLERPFGSMSDLSSPSPPLSAALGRHVRDDALI